MANSVWLWLSKDAEWVFSGIGVAAIGLVCRCLFTRHKAAQIQKSGKNSTNMQAGGDIHFGGRDDKRS